MATDKKVVELNLNDILPNRFQPRISFNEDAINELAESIKKYGVIQPIVVRSIGDKYEIIAGERRYKASVIAGRETIPVIINEMSDDESVEIALIENVQREDLTAIEKAISYKKILEIGKMNQENLAKKIGKSQSAVANTIRLLGLSEETQEAILNNSISERHARSLLKLKGDPREVETLNKIIAERLTVRKTDELISGLLKNEPVKQTVIIEKPVLEPSVVTVVDSPEEDYFVLPDVNIPNIELSPIAPGFMDIERIEREAQDIIQAEQPIADMNSILKPDKQLYTDSVEGKPQEEEKKEEKGDVDMNSNKFFNFFEPGTQNPENNESTSSNPFDLNDFYGQDNAAPTVEPQVLGPIPEVTPTNILEPTAPVEPAAFAPEPPAFGAEIPSFAVPPAPTVPPTDESQGGDQFAFNNNFIQPAGLEQPQSQFEAPAFGTEIPSFAAPTAPAVEPPAFVPETPAFVPEVPVGTPVVENNNNFINPPTIEQPQVELPAQPAVQPAIVPEIPSFEAPVVPPVVETPIEQPTVVPAAPMAPAPEPVSEVVPPVVETPIEQPTVVPAAPMAPTPEPISEVVPPVVETPIEQPTVVPVAPMAPAPEPVPEVVPPVAGPMPEPSGIKSAINAIREVEGSIKLMGFEVDIEEIDFEDSYQATIKITK